MQTSLRVKYPLFLQDSKQAEFSLQIFEKKRPNTKFHKNPPGGGRVVPCGQTDGNDEVILRMCLQVVQF